MWQGDRLHGNLLDEVPKLGIGLTTTWPPEEHCQPPFDEASKDYNLNAKYALSGAQRQRLLTKGLADSDVLEKRDKIPERFYHLITDIASLSRGSALSGERWEIDGVKQKRTAKALEEADPSEGWDIDTEEWEREPYGSPFEGPEALWRALIDIPHRSKYVRNDVFFHGNPVLSKETQLGFEIGSVLRLLRPDSFDSTFEKRWEHDDEIVGGGLMWGFILAFIGQSKSDLEEEQRQLNVLFDLFSNLHEERVKEAERMPTIEEVNNAQYEEVIKEAVKEVGYSPNDLLLREIMYHRPALPDDEELKKEVAKQVMKDIAEVTPLPEVENLLTSLKEDLTVIQERGKSGVTSVRIALEPIWDYYKGKQNQQKKRRSGNCSEETDSDDTPDGASSKWVANEINESQTGVSAVFNRVSDHSDSEVWTNEILLNDYDAERGTNWDLTPYGKTLCYITFERDDDLDWLYHYAIGPEELSLFERKLVINAIDDISPIEHQIDG